MMRTAKLLKRMHPIKSPKDIEPGDFYLDSDNHPCLCIAVARKNDIYEPSISGISLVDGSFERESSITYDAPLRMTFKQAVHWCLNGPRKEDILPVSEAFKKEWGFKGYWWEKKEI